jgi:4-diphosphocytidyl-2-C-methyl-D-erythritol kinase
LGLEVLGRRDDGFHEIRGVFARLELHDTLVLRPASELGVRWPPGMLMPADDLIRKAATLLREATGTHLGARITLKKAIPMAGGLGGGSSDAAATLFALNDLWQTGLGRDELAELGARLGSDVPAFFAATPALVSGRGEIVEPIDAHPDLWVVLAVPEWDVSAKTATVYGALTPDQFTDGRRIDSVVQAIRAGSLADADLANTFEQVIDVVFPSWSDTRATLESASRARFWLTGAGPCLYALLPSEVAAHRALEAIDPTGIPVLISRLAEGSLQLSP